MQVGLVFFQAAQQPLGAGDFFFQCNHDLTRAMPAASLQCHSRRRTQVASWMPGAAGIFGQGWLGKRGVALQLCRHFFPQALGQPFIQLIL
jgi:hypothetical protein